MDERFLREGRQRPTLSLNFFSRVVSPVERATERERESQTAFTGCAQLFNIPEVFEALYAKSFMQLDFLLECSDLSFVFFFFHIRIGEP